MHDAWIICDLRYSGAVVGGAGWFFCSKRFGRTRAGEAELVKGGGMMCGVGRAAAGAADVD